MVTDIDTSVRVIDEEELTFNGLKKIKSGHDIVISDIKDPDQARKVGVLIFRPSSWLRKQLKWNNARDIVLKCRI